MAVMGSPSSSTTVPSTVALSRRVLRAWSAVTSSEPIVTIASLQYSTYLPPSASFSTPSSRNITA